MRSGYRLIGFCIAVAVLPAIASGSAVLLDFEDHAAMDYWAGSVIPPSAQLSDDYLVSHGVSFESGSPYVAVVELGAAHTTSGVNGIGGSTPAGVLTYSRQNPVRLRFYASADPLAPGVTDSVSIRGDLQGSTQTITLNAYDVDGNLVDTMSTLDSGGATLIVQGAGIHEVVFLGSATDDFGVALDDLCFREVLPLASPVEESSWGRVKALFGAAPN